MGRPTIYSDELAYQICELLATGKSMRSVCKNDDMPALATVFRWIRENEDFREQYERAKEESTDALAEELLDIVDNPEIGEVVTEKPDGTEIKRGDMLGHRRLQVDTRKWLMSKMKPKKYGDKLDLTTAGESLNVNVVAGNGNNPSTKS